MQAKANVNWCEDDYATWSRTAEFWNTISNVPIIGAGIAAFVTSQHRSRVFLVCVALVCVGIGSLWFHATLLRSAQAMDEISMLVLCAAFAASIDRTLLWPALALLAVALLLYCMWLDAGWLFIVLFALGLVGASAVAWKKCDKHDGFKQAALWFGVGFVFWLCDKIWCPAHPAQVLHALWHIGASIAGYHAIHAIDRC